MVSPHQTSQLFVMKRTFSIGLLGLGSWATCSAANLYDVGTEADVAMPLKWSVGMNLIYDDNVAAGTVGPKEDSLALNPFVGLSFVSTTPQTTWEVYGRLGLIYYFDEPALGEDVYSQSRLGVNLTHNFNERLRFTSRNFVSYELEPDYSYGYSSSRVLGEYLYWQTDNALGYRWTERFGTYTGIRVGGTEYQDISNNDRFYYEPYVQGRYQLTPQSVVTLEYRYRSTEGSGISSDYTDHYILGGVEHRFSPNTIGILRVGAQLHESDPGTDTTAPYMEFALQSQINQQFRVKAFARYGIEVYDTVQFAPPASFVEYDDRQVFRLGFQSEYDISEKFAVQAGIDYIPSTFDGGRVVSGPAVATPELDETIFNGYIGVSLRFTDYLIGSLSYNYTNSSSDLVGRDYDRNRISVGLTAEF